MGTQGRHGGVSDRTHSTSERQRDLRTARDGVLRLLTRVLVIAAERGSV